MDDCRMGNAHKATSFFSFATLSVFVAIGMINPYKSGVLFMGLSFAASHLGLFSLPS